MVTAVAIDIETNVTCVWIGLATAPPVTSEGCLRLGSGDRSVGLRFRSCILATRVRIATTEATNVLLQNLRRIDIKQHRIQWVGEDAKAEIVMKRI